MNSASDKPKMVEFHIPVRPFSPIDAHNRAAAAKGSPAYAQATALADYNGHHVSLSWNDYRRYYVAEYFWAGRVVLARGDFATCLRAVVDEHARGALGSSASVVVSADDADALAVARGESALVEGSAWTGSGSLMQLHMGPWWTWRHDVGVQSVRDMANPRCPVLIFDWALCQAAQDRNAYEDALTAKYGRVYQ
jgi:hypothetical protein